MARNSGSELDPHCLAHLAALFENADVVITSYTLYRLEVDAYAALRWGGLVLDEAQTVKNHNGKTYQ